MKTLELEKGLPCDVNAERFVLGSVLLDGDRFPDVAAELVADDWSLKAHRDIFASIASLYDRAEVIDRVTVAGELLRVGRLESCGGLSYLVSLDDGLPKIENIDAYVRVVLEHSKSRKIALLGQAITNKALLREPTSEVIEFGFTRLLALGDTIEKRGLADVTSIVRSYPGGITSFLSPAASDRGLRTGLVKLDELTGGLRAQELIILAARPSMGKTALVMQIASYVALRGTPTAAFSLEMSRESLIQRLICSMARVDLQRFRSGSLLDAERARLRKALGELSAAPLHIDDTARLGLAELHSQLYKQKREREIGLVVVDYLQLMEISGKGSSRNEDVSQLSRGLKLLSKEMNCPVIALSQLSRATETRQGDHRPKLSDLRDSGSLEQDADIVGFVFREEVYKRDREDLKGLAELILAKQRNGPIGTANLVFLHHFVRFENRAEDLDAGEGQ